MVYFTVMKGADVVSLVLTDPDSGTIDLNELVLLWIKAILYYNSWIQIPELCLIYPKEIHFINIHPI